MDRFSVGKPTCSNELIGYIIVFHGISPRGLFCVLLVRERELFFLGEQYAIRRILPVIDCDYARPYSVRWKPQLREVENDCARGASCIGCLL